ncbi:glycosyl hydrolase [Agromyces luteolus]|uniref:Glycosyl hydrolase n=1 Tax=Agromyces luteolus TaxID=88373 RepID=A0A7C9HJI1_9MICO|nr:glycoside hydrolase family 3 C-terminal domain-containing protein [Agromyces luteolus]MUN08628.1 glycosyl hydrolase [Agromyces luteolus]GLK27168.1 glycosyl hydrolase [Agromyces luteolus]
MTTATRETISDEQLIDLLGRLDLETKIALITGQDFWSTTAVEAIGLRSMVLSDGPSGVRGPVWDERSPSLNLPSATALSSSWSTEVASEYGHVSAAEARRKGVDVVLGPTINLHRSPLGGRHFEAFSEDPLLTAELAAAYVRGVQEQGVAATPKHYVANDFETDRFNANTVVGGRALRELYLLAFEKAVTESHAWVLMSAYNSINGVTATEHELLETPLNSEWGFDGVVVSDWTAVRSLDAARASQDLEMPGPVGAWGAALVAAVRGGEVDEGAIDRKVLRILRLAARVGALEGAAPRRVDPIDGVAFAREAEIQGAVLVENRGVLPWSASPSRIAVIGHNATAARSQGGGSATVVPEHVIAPLEGITAAFPSAQIDYAIGAVVQEGLSDLPLAELTNPHSGGPGVRVRFLDESGAEIFAEDRLATSYVWFGGDAPIARARTIEMSTRWAPREDAHVRLGFAGVGHGIVTVDGEIIVDAQTRSVGDDLGAALLAPPSRSGAVPAPAGVSRDVVVSFSYEPLPGGLAGAIGVAFGVEPDASDPEALLEEAENLAAMADAVVLVVGTNSRVESEGYDRGDLTLPGRQDELARRVLAANPKTVVVVNSGSPVVMPWADQAGAVLLTWFGGQEYGAALGDILSGEAEPGGRLPTTWPREQGDVPVIDVTPVDGDVRYDEGIHIGYRAWLRAGVAPRYWFGAGEGYTRFETSRASARPVDDGVAVTVDISNVGERDGKHVVQVYIARSQSAVDRPVRWLAGFARVDLAPGEHERVALTLPRRTFAHWDDGWKVEPGCYDVQVCADAANVIAAVEVMLD